MRGYSLVLVAVAAGLISGCSVPIQAGSHLRNDEPVAVPATFSWNQPADRALGDPRLEGNQFFEARLHESVEWHLALRGIHPAASSPTYLVHHHLTLADHDYVAEVLTDAGVAQTEERYEMGSVTVHIVEAATGETVWLGWAQANVEPALKGPDQMRAWVNRIVQRMFSRWPVLTRTSQ